MAVKGEWLWPLTPLQPLLRLTPSKPMGSGASSAVTEAVSLTTSRREE
jgi:hypothetical protein